MSEDLRRTTRGSYNDPGPKHARKSQQRAASCDSTFRDGQRRQPRPSVSPLVAWDDSALHDKHYIPFRDDGDLFQLEDAHMGVAIRRTENTNVFHDSASEEYLSSRPSSPAESDSVEDFVEKRFSRPAEYFQELDDMTSKIYQNSVFKRYIDGTKYRPFDTKIDFDLETPFLENASFQQCGTEEILWFCQEVTDLANKNVPGPSQSPHLADHRMAWENIKTMKEAHYCGSFISLLVLDRTRQNVARLVRIECGKIEELVNTFEICLFQIISGLPNDVLLAVVSTYASEVSAACRQLLVDLDVKIPIKLKDLWRCTVHVLDFAVLSYAGAHTQVFGNHQVMSVTLPGPFLETQYFGVRLRSFSCLSEFLGRQQVWVLESFDTYLSSLLGLEEPPHLSLSTDAMTFGDIWGPMWKSSVLGDEERIVQYKVGNGVIIPCHTRSEGSRDAVKAQKDEILKGEIVCHWMSNKESREDKDFARASYLREKDILLIGASVRLEDKGGCPESTAQLRERFRDSGALSQPSTVSPGWELSTVTGALQATPPFVTGGLQKQYKLRVGRYMTKCLIDHWKNDSESRNVEVLEQWLGLEVSACTYNSRRIRLIELFGTQTMLNHLLNASIQWTDPECERNFYSALQDSDYKAFRRLYKSRRGWQTDLEFPNQLLGKKCQHNPPDRFDPKHIGGGSSPPRQIRDGSLLQTSSHLNSSCVPNSLRGWRHRIKNSRHVSSAPRYEFGWCLTALKEGDVFEFGAKGHLKVITRLSKDQVLVEWRNPNRPQDILHNVSHKVLTMASVTPIIRKVVDSPPPRLMHYERIQAEDSNTKPVHFLIISKSKEMLRSRQSSRRPSLHADSNPTVHQYESGSSLGSIPRTTPSQPIISQRVHNDLIRREIVHRFSRQLEILPTRIDNNEETTSQGRARR
ncbi:uncharacterized protein K444DRAFT_659366 [Hyaloscypha bicolor E]|uniref:Uncharacterized protein n=1 Tax=Hyaloscypha bicolor E TaxID=1095630 RepID=A0A2J6TT05_9HELO|nr:uncharacterized protein K444DRAFT_659366 [Hyaloscypha bicolor E]PMD66154.1 hypothetical protein K444DRAFT_659366 [Hyaloscypha bicolor E]